MTKPAPPADLLPNASLFLDFDGTLVEIAEHPDAVSVEAELSTLMGKLTAYLDGRVAIVSGRPAHQVLALFGASAPIVVGSHGMEFHWRDGRIEHAPRPATLAPVLDAMQALSAQTPGVVVEDKPLGAALHFRQAPHAEQACVALAETLAEQHALFLQPGKMMVEVRAPGGDKGSAIRTLMAEPGFASARPLFMGDDHTDEPGFAATADLGGAGILIGPERPSAARYRLDGVDAALAWLDAASEAPQ